MIIYIESVITTSGEKNHERRRHRCQCPVFYCWGGRRCVDLFDGMAILNAAFGKSVHDAISGKVLGFVSSLHQA
jgi:hypothetical protein